MDSTPRRVIEEARERDRAIQEGKEDEARARPRADEAAPAPDAPAPAPPDDEAEAPDDDAASPQSPQPV